MEHTNFLGETRCLGMNVTECGMKDQSLQQQISNKYANNKNQRTEQTTSSITGKMQDALVVINFKPLICVPVSDDLSQLRDGRRINAAYGTPDAILPKTNLSNYSAISTMFYVVLKPRNA